MTAAIAERRGSQAAMQARLRLFVALMGLAVACLLVSPPARAQSHGGGHGGGGHPGGGHDGGHGGGRGGGHGGGGWHGDGPGWWGLGLGLGLGWGVAELADPYPYAYYGYPDGAYPYAQPMPYTQPLAPDPGAAPTVAPAAGPAAPSASWYYCDSAKGYYPYIPQCPEGWRLVPAAPPGPAH